MKVFLGSTSRDLQAYRNQASDALKRLGTQVEEMEVWGAVDGEPLAVCLKKVEECDLYVGIFAYRYGYIPAGEEYSITELEYEHAKKLNKSRFCFLVDERIKWPPEHIEGEPGQSKLRSFKAKLKEERVVDWFTTTLDLGKKVASSVGRHLWQRKVQAGEADLLDLLMNEYQLFIEQEIDVPRLLPIHQVLPRLLKVKEMGSEKIKEMEQEEKRKRQKGIQFTGLLQKHFQSPSSDSYAVVTGIPGVGKTSSSLQLAREQLRLVKEGQSTLIPLWLDLGEKEHRDIVREALKGKTSPEQIQIYWERLTGGIQDSSQLLIQEDWRPLWILDSWNEAPLKFQHDNKVLNLLSKQPAFLVFSRPGSEPPTEGYYRWRELERYTLL
ncbi:MAG: DUF4062 domain-containing protein, partial [Candidatus Hermodarchaeota archaeon]